jgi:hypothetical protein
MARLRWSTTRTLDDARTMLGSASDDVYEPLYSTDTYTLFKRNTLLSFFFKYLRWLLLREGGALADIQ